MDLFELGGSDLALPLKVGVLIAIHVHINSPLKTGLP
jgi:hypothetical protein